MFIMKITWKVLYNSLPNSNYNVKKITIGHICYSKNCVPSPPHTQNCLNKDMPNYNRFHVSYCYLKVTFNILLYDHSHIHNCIKSKIWILLNSSWSELLRFWSGSLFMTLWRFCVIYILYSSTKKWQTNLKATMKNKFNPVLYI